MLKSRILGIALILCVFIPVLECRVYIHARSRCYRGCGGHHGHYGNGYYGNNYHYHNDECDWFETKVQDEYKYAREIINEYKEIVEKADMKEIADQLKKFEESNTRGDENYVPIHVPKSEEEYNNLTFAEKQEEKGKAYDEERRKKNADEIAQKKRYEKEEERLKKEVPQFEDGQSCIDGSPAQAVKDTCDNDFSTQEFNSYITKEFGKRCKNRVCNFHHLRQDLVCRSTSIQATAILILTLTLLGLWLPYLASSSSAYFLIDTN